MSRYEQKSIVTDSANSGVLGKHTVQNHSSSSRVVSEFTTYNEGFMLVNKNYKAIKHYDSL